MSSSNTKNEESTPRRSPKKSSPPGTLRRSTRKRAIPNHLSSVFATPPPSTKKPKKIIPTPAPSPPPTLTTLPYVVTRRLLQYCDVDTLESLSATCSYFDLMISGRFLTSINFPFNVDFNAEVAATSNVEKKPLLKMRCKKSKDEFKIFPDMPDEFSEPSSIHKIIVENCPGMTEYMVQSQLSLLSLENLREIDLVPDKIMDEGGNRALSQRVMNSYSIFDLKLLRQISRFGSLSCVTRLDVLVDIIYFYRPMNDEIENYLEQFMSQFPSLIELGLFITTSNKRLFYNDYIPRLESVIAASKAPVLKLTVVNETRRQAIKVLKNKFVEKLVVKGPCTMNLVPIMENLKEVEVLLDSSHPNANCTYWKSKFDDRNMHRAGLCCLNIGTLYQNCPKIEKYMGVDVGSVSQDLLFNKWNSRIKKKLYQLYIDEGGAKEFKVWSKTRWYSRRPATTRSVE